MKIIRISWGLALVAICIAPLALTSGCNGGPKVVPVEGTVTLNGKPLDKILVEFWPTSDGAHSFGETDAQGHFVLTMEDGKSKGAVVGNHKVVLKDTSVLGDKFLGRAAENIEMGQGRKPRIAITYQTADATPLRQSVDANGKNNFTYEVKAK